MNIKENTKKHIKKKINKILFRMIRPFIPFIIIIISIILAICTVSDALFNTEDDMYALESMSGDNYETQYAEWLQVKNTDATIITDGKSLVPNGIFIWPIPGYTNITSHFGMRTHPITKVYKLHSGTDVSAPIGANFVAMANGTVTYAGYNSAYGNMVMIDHRKQHCNFICTRL